MSREHKGKAPSQKADDKDIHSEQTLEEVRDTPVSINHPPGSESYEYPEEDELERTYEPGGERVKKKLPMSIDDQIEEEKRTNAEDYRRIDEEEEKRTGRKPPPREQPKQLKGKDHEPKKHK